jgi:hypothetical protein
MHPKILAAKRSKRENLSWWKAFAKAFWSKGVGKKEMKGGRSARRMVGDKTRRDNSDSKTTNGSNGIRGTFKTWSLRSKSRRRTEGGEEEKIQEIQAPLDFTYLSFGRRSADVSTRGNLALSVALQNVVLDVIEEDSKIKIGDENENVTDAIVETSIMSEGKEEISKLIEHSVSYNGHDGNNDEENVLSKTEVVTNDANQV